MNTRNEPEDTLRESLRQRITDLEAENKELRQLLHELRRELDDR